jgi:hypothetical protein
MQLLLRRPFAASDVREAVASWPVTLFVMLVSGFVISELFTEWPAAETVFVAAPTWIAATLGWPAATGWLEGVWALAVVPMALWSALAGATRLLGEKESMANLWRRMALPMAVVIAAGHMSKGLAKFVSWAQFLPGALNDSIGLDTVQAISANTLPPPVPFLGLPAVAGVGLVLVLARLLHALREYRLARPTERARWRAYLPIAALAMMFGAMIVGWLIQ